MVLMGGSSGFDSHRRSAGDVCLLLSRLYFVVCLVLTLGFLALVSFAGATFVLGKSTISRPATRSTSQSAATRTRLLMRGSFQRYTSRHMAHAAKPQIWAPYKLATAVCLPTTASWPIGL